MYGYVQGFMETTNYQIYQNNTGNRITAATDVFKKLLVSADSFIVHDANTTHITTGFTEFDRGDIRAALMNLSGELLATGRYEELKSLLRQLASLQVQGMIPGTIHPDGTGEYGSADVSLWFVEAVHRYYQNAPDKEKQAFMREMLPVINRIVQRYMKKTGPIHMDQTDQLIVVPDHSTSMDSPAQDRLVIPRGGKPIEIQALFYNAVRIARDLNALGRIRTAKLADYDRIISQTARSIHEWYFIKGEPYPYDVIDGNESIKHDIRPHALLLMSLSATDDLLTDKEKTLIIKTVEKQLLTPYGLRSLAPTNGNYYGTTETVTASHEHKTTDYQGAVSPYYLTHYIYAKMRIASGKSKNTYNSVMDDVKLHVNNLLFVAKEGQVSEYFSGNTPFTSGGRISSVYSIAALLEIMALITTETALHSEALANSPIKIANVKSMLAAM
jgi:predicted glycogen debranching enzyme